MNEDIPLPFGLPVGVAETAAGPPKWRERSAVWRRSKRQHGPGASAARSAMAEAAAQYQKGLDQLALLPDNCERLQQELESCSALGAALLVVKGNAAPETGHACARARELWEQLGSPLSSFGFPMGSHSVTRSAANWIWRCDWTTVCCV